MAGAPDDCRWLPCARLNIAESALCARDPDAAALLWAEEEAPEVGRRSFCLMQRFGCTFCTYIRGVR